MEWIAKSLLDKHKLSTYAEKNFGERKANMIATSVAIGAGFKLD
ncbi:hypothetical protein [Staphylococcus aureus]|nr:hypothetical protein [Staphylococcus aureus]